MNPMIRRVLWGLGLSAALLLVSIAMTLQGGAEQAYAQLCKQFPMMMPMPHCKISLEPKPQAEDMLLAQGF